jgi:hypothetical protein
VDPANLGDNVECPFCKTVFAAIKPGAVLPQAPPRVIEAEMVRPGWPAREGSWQPRSGRDESAGEPAGGKLKKVVRTVGGTRTITRIGILSAAKMSAAMSFVISLIVALIYGAFLLFVFLLGASLTGDPSGILGLGIYAICALVIMPFLYALAGFIGGAIWALIYNLLAQLIGGGRPSRSGRPRAGSPSPRRSRRRRRRGGRGSQAWP